MKVYHDMFLKLIEENKTTIDEKLKENPNFIQILANESIKSSSQMLHKHLDKDKKNMLADVRNVIQEYNKRLYRRWKKPIDNLETLIEISYECAVMYEECFKSSSDGKNQLLFYALRTIHARSLLTARECLVLLKNGYADGAFSRWRTLYELSVVGSLLFDKNNEDLCQRYLDYFHIQAYTEEKICREKGHPSHTDDSFENLRNNYDYVISKYGKKYKNGDYGWASEIFHKDKVTFKDIEDESNMGNLRGYYKSSSMYIHGNYKATEESLGIMPNIEKMLLVGPSNYGLSIPMQNVAISLVSITTSFLLIHPTIDTISACSIMKIFMEKILFDADRIQTKIENDDSKLRGNHSNILLTGFKGINNSSSVLLNKIRTFRSADKLELTNSFITSEKELIKKLNNNYRYVISFGQKPLINNVCIELITHKEETEIKTNFPYNNLGKFLNEKKIDFNFSENAGSYLCNNIYFEGLNYINRNNLNTKMIFIHIPPLNVDYDFNNFAHFLSEFIDLL